LFAIIIHRNALEAVKNAGSEELSKDEAKTRIFLNHPGEGLRLIRYLQV